MSQNPHETPGVPDARAGDDRDPMPSPPDSTPDALTDTEVDEVRGSSDEPQDVTDVESAYGLQSQVSQAEGSDDDPASFLNI
ncbi:hypothetical protein [Actinotalea sp. K2]|uniref:hypothetical protein n=1 Tax=Actinotalea sp. K2 TaxID=2939438 RepID=UPI002017FDE7|nr:hypothetical protein [Actinotalea sp. K2]MCL3861420.1 hypothetical protein [Actinotalea sp. K2]